MPRTAAPPRTANAALSFHIERCPRRLPIASAVKYERPAIASTGCTAQSPTFTSHDVGAAALERVCAVVPQLKTSSSQAAAWICHPIVSRTKAVGDSSASSGASLTPPPLHCPTSKLPEIEAATVPLLRHVVLGFLSPRRAALWSDRLRQRAQYGRRAFRCHPRRRVHRRPLHRT